MMWALLFIGVAAVSSLFGFGILASAGVAQAISIVFLTLGLVAVALQVRQRDNQRR